MLDIAKRKNGKIKKYIDGLFDLVTTIFDRKCTTIAGTLVYFLVMSILPIAVWLTLVFGKLNFNIDDILSLEIFSGISELMKYVYESAKEASGAASVVFLITSLYSATNLFYHMRKAGEIIYDYKREKAGIKLRLSALVLILVVMLLVAALIAMLTAGRFFLSIVINDGATNILTYLVVMIVGFALCVILNLYISPYRIKIEGTLAGSFFTCAAWLCSGFLFNVYLKYSSLPKFYGAIAAFIVFLLWLYIMMTCFIIGVIINYRNIEKHTEGHKKF